MRILLTNDDGPFAAGLAPLRDALAGLGDVTVLCPDRERSGAGHAITVLEPLRTREVPLPDGSKARILTGTPADCVKFAVLREPDAPYGLVVSGVNLGINAGADMFYSGTVAAALEAALLGIPGLALSTDPANADRMDAVVAHGAHVLRMLLDSSPPRAWVANVNVPLLSGRQPAVCFTRQAHGFASGDLTRTEGPRGRVHYWVDAPVGAPDAPEDSDVAVLSRGDISVTPLRADLTDEAALEQLRRT